MKRRRQIIVALLLLITLITAFSAVYIGYKLSRQPDLGPDDSQAGVNDGTFVNICGTNPPSGNWAQHNANPACQGCTDAGGGGGTCTGNVVKIYECAQGEQEANGIECRANGRNFSGTFDSNFVNDCKMYQVDVFSDFEGGTLRDFVVWRGNRFGSNCTTVTETPQQYSISGRVYCLEDGRALSGFGVDVLGDGRGGVTTNSSGNFTFSDYPSGTAITGIRINNEPQYSQFGPNCPAQPVNSNCTCVNGEYINCQPINNNVTGINFYYTNCALTTPTPTPVPSCNIDITTVCTNNGAIINTNWNSSVQQFSNGGRYILRIDNYKDPWHTSGSDLYRFLGSFTGSNPPASLLNGSFSTTQVVPPNPFQVIPGDRYGVSVTIDRQDASGNYVQACTDGVELVCTTTQEVTPTPTPTITSTPSPTPTRTPTPTPSPSPSPTVTPSSTPSPTPTASPTPSPTITLTPTTGPSPTPTQTPVASPTPTVILVCGDECTPGVSTCAPGNTCTLDTDDSTYYCMRDECIADPGACYSDMCTLLGELNVTKTHALQCTAIDGVNHATVTYTVTVINPDTENPVVVTVTDTISSSLAPYLQQNSINPAASSVVNNVITWTNVNIAAGGTAIFTYQVVAPQSVFGTHINTVVVTEEGSEVARIDHTAIINCLPPTALDLDDAQRIVLGLLLLVAGFAIYRFGLHISVGRAFWNVAGAPLEKLAATFNVRFEHKVFERNKVEKERKVLNKLDEKIKRED